MIDAETTDQEMAAQFERVIRRVKSSMSYRGSFSTRDILGALVVRWLQSGEWARLKQLPPDQRYIGKSVRRFILDRIDLLRNRGEATELPDDLLSLPDETTLIDLIEETEMRLWIEERVVDLEAGTSDPRVKIPLVSAQQVGRALRLHITGRTQRQIADELGLSLGVANKRLADGTNYLILLQAIECGLGGMA
ncbi:MAG: hypothetical protein SFX73_27025 [Kofleriaceae bacterium]|nr:hypothetical protein [Kofleriaceae bacterium]